MKKAMLDYLLATLMLLVLALWPAAALGETQLRSMATVGEQVYAVQQGELAVYDASLKAFVNTGREVPGNFILADSPEGLYLFSLTQQLLVALDEESPDQERDRWQVPLSGDIQAEDVDRAVVLDDTLYLLAADNTSDTFRGLWAYDLRAQQEVRCPIPSVLDATWAGEQGVVVYSAPLGQESALYIWRIHENAAMLASVQGGPIQAPCGLAYHAANQMIYFQVSGAVMAFDGHTLQAVGSTMGGFDGEPKTAAVTQDNAYWLSFDDWSTQSFPMFGENQTVLSIAGMLPNPAWIETYCTAHPDVALIYTPDNPHSEHAFAEALINRSLKADMIVTSTASTLYQTLIQKGYVLPLDGSAPLTEALSCMDPAARAQASWEGRYYALPVSLAEELMGYDAQLFEELGLTVPTTVEELLRLCLDTELPSDVCLMAQTVLDVSDVLLKQVMDIGFAKGADADLQTMRELLGLWEQFSLRQQQSQPPAGERALFAPMYCLLSENILVDSERYRPLMLSAAADQPPIVHASMEVIMIYAGTQKAEACQDFMVFCAQNLAPESRIALIPDENEPVAREGLAEQLQALQDELSLVDKALEQGGDQENLLLQREELALRQQALEDDPWQISPADIATYREVAQSFFFASDLCRYDTNNLQFYQLREKLRQHQISPDQFLQQYQNVLNMMLLEQ